MEDNKFRKAVNTWVRIFLIGWKHLLTINLKVTAFVIFLMIMIMGMFFLDDTQNGYVEVNKKLIAANMGLALLAKFIYLNVAAFLSTFIIKNARDEFYRRDNKSLQKQLKEMRKNETDSR